MKHLPIAIKTIMSKQDLSQKEAYDAMNEIMKGEASAAQIAAFLVALRMKGEQILEITGLAEAMRDHAQRIKPKAKWFVDTCGTGGDLSNTFNISTGVAFIVAAAGVPVAKHGNRSVSSHCGSADVLEALGVKIDLNPKQVQKCIDQVDIGFMFAPVFHPAMKNVAPVRKELGVRTIFNLLGPLTNPAHAPAQIIGVYDGNLTSVVAKTLRNLGVKRAMVVHGAEGLDEISIGHKTKISELKNGQITSYFLDPEALGLKLGNLTQILGSNAKNNAHILKHLLQGKEHSSRSDILCLNAAAALMVGKKASDWKSALKLAQDVLYSGKALKKLEELIKFSQKVK